ncbi:MAG: ABC transporter [Halobacteriovorax sp.]|nr:ABC transporter [Halobacteriovorax sp.]|tara:strand:+ start:64708 stop:66468 length:1761 start_codon:yes stop_codon:yes gene_type:complete
MTPFQRLLTYTRGESAQIKRASLYSFLNKLFDLAPPILIGMAVDIVVKGEDSLLGGLGITSTMNQLWVVAFLTLIIWGAESLFEYLFQLDWRNLAQEVQHRLRMDAYRHVQDLEVAYFEDKSTGSLISILNDDVNQLERFLDVGANDIIQVATTVVLVGGVFFYLSPMVAAFAFLPVPIILWGSFLFQKKIEPRYANMREEVGLLGAILSNNLSGASTVKSYGAEEFEVERLAKQSKSYIAANEHAIKLSSSFSPLIRMAVLMGFLATLILGGKLVQDKVLEVGSYSVLIFMTQRLLWPLTRLGATFDLYQRAMASTQRIFNLIDTPIKIVPGKLEKSRDSVEGHIIFNNVDFSYDTGPKVLKGISLEVKPGETIGLVGPTGSGKSTLIKLLLRFYESKNGQISLDGENIKNYSFPSLRGAFSYVGQDNYLFHGSAEENIKFGSFDATSAEVEEASKKAEAHNFIESSLENSYDTIVGERGQKLSGGQRQRMAIARAILKNAPIYLFDEATSAVDNETEAAIQRSLEKITKEKTTIIVAHRLSTIVHADRIYVLDKGEIVEKGTHTDLLGRKGLYSSLWTVQTGSR